MKNHDAYVIVSKCKACTPVLPLTSLIEEKNRKGNDLYETTI
jgi:hypothetical protein